MPEGAKTPSAVDAGLQRDAADRVGKDEQPRPQARLDANHAQTRSAKRGSKNGITWSGARSGQEK